MLSAVAGLVAAASVVGLMVSLVKTIIHGDKRLLAYCGYNDGNGRSHLTIANECPFDPTRIFVSTKGEMRENGEWMAVEEICAFQSFCK